MVNIWSQPPTPPPRKVINTNLHEKQYNIQNEFLEMSLSHTLPPHPIQVGRGTRGGAGGIVYFRKYILSCVHVSYVIPEPVFSVGWYLVSCLSDGYLKNVLSLKTWIGHCTNYFEKKHLVSEYFEKSPILWARRRPKSAAGGGASLVCISIMFQHRTCFSNILKQCQTKLESN